MSEYTPEPWKVTVADHNGQYGVWITDGSRCVAEGVSLQDASRIVTCVNACAGIATKTLAAPGTIDDIIAAALDRQDTSVVEAELSRYKGYYAQAIEERDEARARAEKAEALLEECVVAHDCSTSECTMEKAIERASAFLASIHNQESAK